MCTLLRKSIYRPKAVAPNVGGSGKMTIFYSMAVYGTSRSKQQCPICRQWFLRGTEHKETCDRCGGTGRVTTAMDRRNQNRESKADEALSYLTPAELALYYNLVDQLKGHYETVPCRLCQGRGNCISCRGIGYIGEFPCPTCGGLGRCSSCGGKKNRSLPKACGTYASREGKNPKTNSRACKECYE